MDGLDLIMTEKTEVVRIMHAIMISGMRVGAFHGSVDFETILRQCICQISKMPKSEMRAAAEVMLESFIENESDYRRVMRVDADVRDFIK